MLWDASKDLSEILMCITAFRSVKLTSLDFLLRLSLLKNSMEGLNSWHTFLLIYYFNSLLPSWFVSALMLSTADINWWDQSEGKLLFSCSHANFPAIWWPQKKKGKKIAPTCGIYTMDFSPLQGQDVAFEPAKLLWLIQRDFLRK